MHCRLQLAVRLLKPKDNDEIIVPTITFVATINSVIYNNCSPIFMDCDDHLMLDKNKFYNFIKKNTFYKKGFTFNKKQKEFYLLSLLIHSVIYLTLTTDLKLSVKKEILR